MESALIAKLDDELPRMLTKHLQRRFDSAEIKKAPLVASPSIQIQAGKQEFFTVMLGRSKYEKDEWVLLVGPAEISGLSNLIGRRKPTECSPELIQICQEIHAFLTATPGISATRWYFEGFRSQSAAVATPDELPWTQA
jgi:hypothetical protein